MNQLSRWGRSMLDLLTTLTELEARRLDLGQGMTGVCLTLGGTAALTGWSIGRLMRRDHDSVPFEQMLDATPATRRPPGRRRDHTPQRLGNLDALHQKKL